MGRGNRKAISWTSYSGGKKNSGKWNGRKSITTISGLEQDLDFVKLLKAFKKSFQCIGSLDVKTGTDIVLAIKLSGDQRENVKKFLLSEEIIPDEKNIVLHGG